jgi:UDP:flavonoid glycosyltransferase YjiC (YdhE family)
MANALNSTTLHHKNYTNTHLNILVTPLHWGLGHATRCIPLIRQWLSEGHQVVLASDGGALALLRAEFPALTAIELPSYNIEYRSADMVFNMALQMPRILRAVRAEHRAIARVVQVHDITHIVSDNRYGCWHRGVHNIFLTHQLHLRVPNPALQWLANALQRMLLKRFDAIWVPDVAEAPGLAGELSHPPLQRPPVRYIGWLTRLPAMEVPRTSSIRQVAIILSGPEPQRSHLESILMSQIAALSHVQWTVVRGLAHLAPAETHPNPHVTVVNWLDSAGIEALLRRSDAVICRSGYSTLMDLAATGHRALLIPTPGQTEQLYLAEQLEAQGVFQRQEQHTTNLQAALAAWESGAYQGGLSSSAATLTNLLHP